MKYPRTKSQDIIWMDNLDSTASVIQNGGTFGGQAEIVDKALVLDGATDYVTYGNTPALTATLNKFSFSVWFKTTDDSVEYLMAKYVTAGNGTFYVSKAGATRIDVAIELPAGKAQVTAVHASITDNAWHHIVGTYDGTTLTRYLDGAAAGSTGGLTGAVSTTTQPFVVGSISDVSGFAFTGSLKKVKLFNKALTADEVLDLYQEDTFTEIDDSKALMSLPFRTQYDASSVRVTDNIGSIGGTVTVGDGTTSTTFPTTLVPKGFSFDGGDYVVSDTVSSMSGDFTGSFTALIKRGNKATFMSVTSLGANSGSAGVSFGMGINSQVEGALSAEFNSRTHRTAGGLILEGPWYHVAVTKAAGTILAGTKLYINGEEVAYASTPAATTPNLSAGPFKVGDWVVPGAGYYNGTILAPRLWNIELTPTQVKELCRRDFKLINT